MVCNICGKNEEECEAIIEGTKLSVCETCAKFGKIVSRIRPPEIKKNEKSAGKNPRFASATHQETSGEEIIQIISPDFATEIKKARESMNLKQEDAAKLLNEKESLLHKIESGTFTPGIELARKLERFFKIQLIQEHKESHQMPLGKTRDGALTLGDLIRQKQRKS